MQATKFVAMIEQVDLAPRGGRPLAVLFGREERGLNVNDFGGWLRKNWIQVIVLGVVSFGAKELYRLNAQVSSVQTQMTAMIDSPFGLVKAINLSTAHLAKIDGSVEAICDSIKGLHPKDIGKIRCYQEQASTGSGLSASLRQLLGLPESVEVAVKSSEAVPGAIAISIPTAVAKKLGEFSVPALASGRAIKVEQRSERVYPPSSNRPEMGMFWMVEIADQTGMRVSYDRLSSVAIAQGNQVAQNQAIGLARAASPICLRLCIKMPGSDTCLDPRPFLWQ